MRTTKRFTPSLLRSWKAKGRGTGDRQTYLPWHQVTRGDPASRGRSHLISWHRTGRLCHFLSDGELVAFYFATMLPGVADIREQFPLSLQAAPHELSAYSASYLATSFPGTQEIALRLGVKHPALKHLGDKEPWNPTTDLLVACQIRERWSLLAVSVKPDANALSERAMQLLQLEQTYWRERNVPWLLITPSQYDQRVGRCLQRTAPWVISEQQASEGEIGRCREVAFSLVGYELSTVLNAISSTLSVGMEWAQSVFWQSVWRCDLPLDLRRGWRPQEPIALLNNQAFVDLNPLAARRSAC